MAETTPKTIILKGADYQILQNEAAAGGSILPGHLVAINSTGAVVVHPTAGGSAPDKAFAIEDDAFGKGITDAYASGRITRYALCSAGTEVYAILADNMNIAIGDLLESAGDGTLRKHVAQTAVGATSPAVAVRFTPVARALQAVNTTTSPVATARIKARVL